MARRVETYEQADVVRAGGGWWLVHGLPLVAPGIACAGFALLVHSAHEWGGGDAILTPILSIVAFLVGSALTGFGWMAAGNRPLMKVLVVVSGGAGTINLVMGLILGFERPFMVWVFVVSSAIVWALWVIWRGAKYGGATASGTSNALMQMLETAPVQFAKPRKDNRGVIRAKFATTPGGVLDDARALVPPLAAHAKAVPGGAHLVTHPDKDGVGEIEIPTIDNLKQAIPWPGLTANLQGILPTDPFPVGEYQTGPCRVQIVGDIDADRNAPDISHVKIGGSTGSGKSTGAQVLLGNMMGMRRLNTVGLDLSTELQILGPLAGGLTWLITDEEVARLFMQRIHHVTRGRKAHLATEGLKRWAPRSSLNLLVCWFEESKELNKYNAAYVKLVSDARAAGIWVVSSTQSWLYRSLSTDVRKQHPSGICFGMTEADDVGHVLPDEAIEALGKRNLPTWGNSKPGYCYIAGLGIPRHKWAKMLRMHDPLAEQLREAVVLGAPYRDPMDPVTAALFGELFAHRTRYDAPAQSTVLAEVIAPAGWGRSEPTPPRSRTAQDREGFEDYEDQEEAERVAEELNAQDREEMLAELAEARRRNLGDAGVPDDFADVDPEAPIEVDVQDDGEEDDEAPALSPAEAQRVWDELLDQLYRSGARQVSTGVLTDWLIEVRRERTFLYRQRDRWEAAGCITPHPEADGWDLIASPLEPRRQGPPHGE